VTTNHLYCSPQWQMIEERQNGTGTSNVTFQYVWGAGNIDEQPLRDTYSGGVRVQAQRLYVQQDANNDVTALVNTSGQVQERYLYDPYGDVTITDANWNPTSGNTSSFGSRYLFQGSRLDTVTGWYDFRNRDLIPSEGRWAERDPLGLAAGDPNIYRFVGNSPTNAIDPSGLAVHLQGPWSDKERDRIYGALKKIKHKLPILIKQIDDQIARLKACPDSRPKRKAVAEAQHLRDMLSLLNTKLNDPKFQWDLRHEPLYKPIYPLVRQADGITYDNENTEWPTIYLNDAIKNNWTTVDDELARILFHELTHLAGSEDDDSEGLLGNANTIAHMINGSFTNNPVWRAILMGTPLNPVPAVPGSDPAVR
jgi:RHS repeat-associated protein